LKRILTHALLLSALAAAPVLAQTPDTTRADLRGLGVGPGSRVRVSVAALAPEPVVGKVVSLTADTLLLSTGSARLALESRGVRRLEVSTGRRRLPWALAGAGIGFLVGGTVGGYAAGHSGGGDQTDGLAALAGFVAGSILGIPIGGAVGAVAAPEHWTPVRLPRPEAPAAAAP
jgi:hypothetical protein